MAEPGSNPDSRILEPTLSTVLLDSYDHLAVPVMEKAEEMAVVPHVCGTQAVNCHH